MLEEEALHVQAAAEAGERAVGADHAVARQDERERVLAVGGADGARGIRTEAEPPRLLAVADGLPVGDRREREPAAPLEVGAVEVERQVERRQLAGEVRLELRRRLVERFFNTDQDEQPKKGLLSRLRKAA